MGDTYYLSGKTNCSVETGGSACSGIHHKLLHSSGVTFCYKISIKVNKIDTDPSGGPSDDKLNFLPNLNQPLSLEIQAVAVHGAMATTMFDNGSTAALVTHMFTEKAGLSG